MLEQPIKQYHGFIFPGDPLKPFLGRHSLGSMKIRHICVLCVQNILSSKRKQHHMVQTTPVRTNDLHTLQYFWVNLWLQEWLIQ